MTNKIYADRGDATILNRIKRLMEYFGDNQSAFANRTGLDKANLSKIMSGQRPIKDGVINKIILATDVRREWLVNDKGDPFISEEEYRERFGEEQPSDYRGTFEGMEHPRPRIEVAVEDKDAPRTEGAAESVNIQREAWEVIRDQAASLKSKDRQIDEVIAMLKEQIAFKGADVGKNDPAAPREVGE